MTCIQVGRYDYGYSPVKTHANFLGAASEYYKGTGGAYDLAKTIKLAAQLSGNEALADKCSGYQAFAAVPLLVSSVKDGLDAVKGFEASSPRSACKLMQSGYSLVGTTAYASAFFSASPKPLLNVGQVFNTAADICETGVLAADICNYAKLSSQLKAREDATPEVRSAVQSKLAHSCIKLAKVVGAVSCGIFACFALFMGAGLVSPLVATVTALGTTLLNTSAFYYKNYISRFELTESPSLKAV